MEEYLAIGLMMRATGDRVDAVLERVGVDSDDVGVEYIVGITEPVPREMSSTLSAMLGASAGDLGEVSALDARIGYLQAEAVNTILRRAGILADEVSVVGSHGLTLFHHENAVECAGKAVRGGLQIGDGAIIAEVTGIPTVTAFRSADMAAGGSGTPLIPIFDSLLARHLSETTAFQKIGGIANVTWVDPAADSVIAFDTGPGNVLVDALAHLATGGSLDFDLDGRIGRTGRVRQEILDVWLKHPYLSARPPKSTGREIFGERFLQSYVHRNGNVADLVRTAEAYTAHTIAGAYRRFLPDLPSRVVVTGGGVRNPVLMEDLAGLLPETTVCAGESVGLNSDLKEAMAFGVLGLYYLLGRHGNIPSATGARHPAVLGKLSLPPKPHPAYPRR